MSRHGYIQTPAGVAAVHGDDTPLALASSFPCGRSRRAAVWLLTAVLLAVILYHLPGRTSIAPHVQSDYNYTFLAADRMFAGHGPTSIFPRAPFQPWEWTADWVVLTQWPVGYPLLLCAVRSVLGGTTLAAAQWISVVACAVALVGWFAWSRRVLPRSVTGSLLGVVAAATAVSTGMLINPATDTIVVAVLPLVLLLADSAMARCRTGGSSTSRPADALRRGLWWMFWAGLGAGLLFWVRYAAIFVPAAIGAVVVIEWLVRRRVRLGAVIAFAAGAAVPVLGLVLVNYQATAAVSVQEQLNLGSTFAPDLDPAIVLTAWWKFTHLPFYDYHWYSDWVFAVVVPVTAIGLVCMIPAWRRAAQSLMGQTSFLLSAASVAVLLALLITATVLFRTKYDYVGLDRYYLASKPLYFLLFIGPVIALRHRAVRMLACGALVLCVHWYVSVEWPRPYQRWLAARRPATEYGRWARCFEPGADDLYAWLRSVNAPHLVICSNFPDEIALETWVPACPLPSDPGQLGGWLERIAAARGVHALDVRFVLDPSNHTREYYLPLPAEVIDRFRLTPDDTVPAPVRPYVYRYRPPAPRLATRPKPVSRTN